MIVVLADDFSGAAEVAGVAHRFGLSAEVRTEFVETDRDCLVIDTNSRSLSPKQAASKVSRIAERIARTKPAWIYKKIDSVLRGPVAAEAKSIATAFNHQQAWIVNANPARGRVVIDGCLRVDGLPVNETFFAADPEHPRLSSCVQTLLGLNAHHEATSERKPGESVVRPDAITISVQNAESSGDLDRLAAAAPEATLLCGGAEFFAALLADRLPSTERRPFTELSVDSGTLIVCGSTVGSLCHQPTNACGELTVLEIETVDDPAAAIAERLNAGQPVGLATSNSGMGMSHQERIRLIAGTVRETLARSGVTQLMVEGGRTASTLAEACGWRRLLVSDVYADGVVGVKPDDKKEMTLIVKPGSYAWPKRMLLTQDAEAAA